MSVNGSGSDCGLPSVLETLENDCDHHANAVPPHENVRGSGNDPVAPVLQQRARRLQGRENTYMMMVSTHREHSEEIHTKAETADQKQLTGIHFWRVKAI